MSRDLLIGARILVGGAGATLLIIYALCDRRNIKRGRRWLDACLVLLALVAVCAYFDFGAYPKFGRFMNPHDFFHYYLGAKYSEEVGYLNLYPAVIVADAENNQGRPGQPYFRGMEDYGFVEAGNALQQKAFYKGLFSSARWEEFRKDVSSFRSFLGKRWPRAAQDKGYNATPVWNLMARALANRVSTGHLLFLVCLDLVLLALMFALVGVAFGWRIMCFSVIFWGALFMMSFTHIRGAFLRLDWLTFLAMALCLLKLERYGTAGALMAYAAMARIFPLVFAFGLGVKFAADILKKRTLNKRYLTFFTAFALVASLLFLATVIDQGGLSQWRAFFTKIALHDRDVSPVRVGFRYIFLMTYKNSFGAWPPFESQKQLFFESHQFAWWGIQLAVLLFSGAAVRKLQDYEALALGYAPAFFLTAPTFYYQVMILVPLFLFLPKTRDGIRLSGAVFMFSISIAAFALFLFWPLDLALCFTLSCLLLVLALYIVFAAFLTRKG